MWSDQGECSNNRRQQAQLSRTHVPEVVWQHLEEDLKLSLGQSLDYEPIVMAEKEKAATSARPFACLQEIG